MSKMGKSMFAANLNYLFLTKYQKSMILRFVRNLTQFCSTKKVLSNVNKVVLIEHISLPIIHFQVSASITMVFHPSLHPQVMAPTPQLTGIPGMKRDIVQWRNGK